MVCRFMCTSVVPSSVCLSVCPVRPPRASAGGLLLWARRAGYYRPITGAQQLRALSCCQLTWQSEGWLVFASLSISTFSQLIELNWSARLLHSIVFNEYSLASCLTSAEARTRKCKTNPHLAVVSHRCGSVAEWLACWTRAQKGPGSNRSRDVVG